MTYSDFLEKLLPVTLQNVAASDLELRKALPLKFPQSTRTRCGNQVLLKDLPVTPSYAHLQEVGAEFGKEIQRLLEKVVSNAYVDVAADLMMSEILHGLLPPVVTLKEGERVLKVRHL